VHVGLQMSALQELPVSGLPEDISTSAVLDFAKSASFQCSPSVVLVLSSCIADEKVTIVTEPVLSTLAAHISRHPEPTEAVLLRASVGILRGMASSPTASSIDDCVMCGTLHGVRAKVCPTIHALESTQPARTPVLSTWIAIVSEMVGSRELQSDGMLSKLLNVCRGAATSLPVALLAASQYELALDGETSAFIPVDALSSLRQDIATLASKVESIATLSSPAPLTLAASQPPPPEGKATVTAASPMSPLVLLPDAPITVEYSSLQVEATYVIAPGYGLAVCVDFLSRHAAATKGTSDGPRKDADPAPLLFASVYKGGTIVVMNTLDCTPVSLLGGLGDAPGQFNHPCGIAVGPAPGRHLLIADRGNNRVQEVTKTGRHIRSIGVGVLQAPHGVAIATLNDTTHVIGVTEFDVGRVSLFSYETGVVLVSCSDTSHRLCHPTGIAMCMKPNSGSRADALLIFVCDETNVISKWNGFGECLGVMGQGLRLRYPAGLLLLPNDVLAIADTTAHRVVFASSVTGELLKAFGAKGSRPGQFRSPAGLAAFGSSLFVLDYDSTRCQEFKS
jgi:hypothetical protein